MSTYRQCLLNRNGAQQVSWIPSKFAVAGRYAKLKENGEWSNGWCVMQVFPGVVAADIIEKNADNYRTHRRATDI